MAPPVNIPVVITSEAQKKGFEAGKKGIDGVANAANNAKPKLDKGAKATAALGEKSKVSGARVGGLVQALLRSIGVTTGAGEASLAAGEAQDAMGNKARLAGAAISAAAVGVAVFLPLLLKLVNRSTEATKKLEELRSEMVGMLAEFKEASEILPDASDDLKEFVGITEELALVQQQLKIFELTDQIQKLEGATQRSIFTIRENVTELIALTKFKIADLAATLELTSAVEDAATKTAQLGKQTNAEVEFNKRAGQAREANRKTVDALRLNLKLLEAAMERGSVLSDETREKLAAERDRRKELADAIKKEKEERESLNFILGKDAILANQRDKRERDEEKKKQEQHDADIQRATERILAIEAERRAEEEAATAILAAKRQKATEERAITASQVSASIGALGQLFGESKAIRIAQALADTFAAANAALATVQPTVPAGVIAAAIATAIGLANVANIRKTEVGFDRPVSDRLVEDFGAKFADDMIRLLGQGFDRRMGAANAAGVGGATNVTNVNNSGMRIANVTVPGFIGTGQTEFLKGLERQLIRVRRLEDRTRIGRSR